MHRDFIAVIDFGGQYAHARDSEELPQISFYGHTLKSIGVGHDSRARELHQIETF